MEERTVVITGANSGIGLEAAVSLASVGDRVIIACRNPVKAAAAVEEIKFRADSSSVETVALDLSALESVRSCAAELSEIAPSIDVLINNAGLIQSPRSTTVDGLETMFGVNHLGHFLLTNLVGDLIKAAPSPRVINVASLAHRFAGRGLNFDDLQSVGFFNVWMAYGRSKLANIHFTQELARRWKPDGVTTSCLHPGMVRSGFGSDGDTGGVLDAMIDLAAPMSISPIAGADTIVWLATAGAGADLSKSGTYWAKRKPSRLSRAAQRPTDAARLWTVSEQLTQLNPV